MLAIPVTRASTINFLWERRRVDTVLALLANIPGAIRVSAFYAPDDLLFSRRAKVTHPLSHSCQSNPDFSAAFTKSPMTAMGNTAAVVFYPERHLDSIYFNSDFTRRTRCMPMHICQSLLEDTE